MHADVLFDRTLTVDSARGPEPLPADLSQGRLMTEDHPRSSAVEMPFAAVAADVNTRSHVLTAVQAIGLARQAVRLTMIPEAP